MRDSRACCALPCGRRRRRSPPACPLAVHLQLDNEGHTLYVNNLFEKCSQDGAYCVCSAASRCPLLLRETAMVAAAAAGCCPPTAHALLPLLYADLKKAMRCIFGQFGNILDVVSRRTYRLRGQVRLGGSRSNCPSCSTVSSL